MCQGIITRILDNYDLEVRELNGGVRRIVTAGAIKAAAKNELKPGEKITALTYPVSESRRGNGGEESFTRKSKAALLSYSRKGTRVNVYA